MTTKQENDTIMTENKSNQNEKNEISETWKVKGFPEYYKTGHVKNIMTSLKLDVIDVFKKTPNNTAYVRFKCVEDKLNAKDIINGYTEKKIKRLHCIETPNRKQYQNDLIKQEKKQRKEKKEKNQKKEKEKKINKEPTSIHQVVTPLFNMDYQEQLRVKQQKLCKDLGYFRRKMTNEKFMNIEFLKWLPKKKKQRGGKSLKTLCPLIGIMSSPITESYRNKVSMTIGYNKISNKLTIGFQLGRFEHGQASIESCQQCINIDNISKQIAKCSQIFVRNQFEKYKYDCFNKKTHDGIWRKLDIRTSKRCKQYVIMLQIQRKQLNDEQFEQLKKDFVSCICDEAKIIKNESNFDLNGISIMINNTVSTANNNDCPIEILYGNNYHYEEICGLKFRISTTAFFQINTKSAERLYETAGQWTISGINDKKIVLFDICCGTGTIGLCIAKKYKKNIKKVIGLELIQDAVNDATFNANINNFDNAQFIAGKAEETLEKVLNEQVDINNDYCVAILDPPRCGVHKNICKLIRKQERIQRVIYVSCNSSSCVNDAIRLCQTPSKKCVGTPFKPIKSIGCDLFPHTDHVEMIIQFDRCKEGEIDWTKLSIQASESHRKYLYEQKQKTIQA